MWPFSSFRHGAWIVAGATLLLAGCVAPDRETPILSEEQMRASLRACEIEAVGYGGPARRYYFSRKDGSQFITYGRGPAFGGSNWVVAEGALSQIIAEETAACDTEIAFIIS